MLDWLKYKCMKFVASYYRGRCSLPEGQFWLYSGGWSRPLNIVSCLRGECGGGLRGDIKENICDGAGWGRVSVGEEWTFLSSSLTSPSSFFMLLHQPVLLYKKERPIARRQSRVCCVCARAPVHVFGFNCDFKCSDKTGSFFSYRRAAVWRVGHIQKWLNVLHSLVKNKLFPTSFSDQLGFINQTRLQNCIFVESV